MSPLTQGLRYRAACDVHTYTTTSSRSKDSYSTLPFINERACRFTSIYWRLLVLLLLRMRSRNLCYAFEVIMLPATIGMHLCPVCIVIGTLQMCDDKIIMTDKLLE